MPLYMDRHYIKGMTKELLDQAHEQDLKVQGKYGVNFITYWFDEARGTSFCLIDAPDIKSIKNAHDEAHGSVPNEIIEVDPAIVESFLGRMKDPEPDKETNEVVIDSAFRVIMFTDLKDSTLLTSTYGDRRGLHHVHVHNGITRSALRNNAGSEIKHTGDGIMASFMKVNAAIECAKEIQHGFGKYNEENTDDQLRLKIGLDAGEPIEEYGDFFGSVVQLAARLCDRAEPGQIMVSSSIYEEGHSSGLEFKDLGKANLKGFHEPVSIFSVIY